MLRVPQTEGENVIVLFTYILVLYWLPYGVVLCYTLGPMAFRLLYVSYEIRR